MNQWQKDLYNLYTEAKQFEAGKFHSKFGNIPQQLRTRGFSVPSRDAMIFISQFLESIGIFSEDETDSVVKNFNAASRRLRFLELLGIHSKDIQSKSAEIDGGISDAFEKYTGVSSINRGRGESGRKEKYEANAAAHELAKQQSQHLKQLKQLAKGDAEAALDTLAAGLDSAEQELLGSLKASYEDPTTMFEIRVENPAAANKVSAFIKSYAPDAEVEVFNNSIEFSADPENQLSKLVSKIGAERVQQALEGEIRKIAGNNRVIIIPPEGTEGLTNLVSGAVRPVRSDTTDTTVAGYGHTPEFDVPEEDEEDQPTIQQDNYRQSNVNLINSICQQMNVDLSIRSKAIIALVGDPELSEDKVVNFIETIQEPFGDVAVNNEFGKMDMREPFETMGYPEDGNYEGEEGEPSLAIDDEKIQNMKNDIQRALRNKFTGDNIKDYMVDTFGTSNIDNLSPAEVEKLFIKATSLKQQGEEESEEAMPITVSSPSRMSPQAADAWMHQERARRMQNQLKQNERWGNY